MESGFTILEDDVEADEVMIHNLSVPLPEDADAIVGTSHGDGNYRAINLNSSWMKIERVFATHAIMHINKRFPKSVIDIGKMDLPNIIDHLMLVSLMIYNLNLMSIYQLSHFFIKQILKMALTSGSI